MVLPHPAFSHLTGNPTSSPGSACSNSAISEMFHREIHPGKLSMKFLRMNTEPKKNSPSISGLQSQRPNETLQEIKQMFRSEPGDNRHIDFFDYTGGGGHAVNPWKISKRSDHPGLNIFRSMIITFRIWTILLSKSIPSRTPGRIRQSHPAPRNRQRMYIILAQQAPRIN